MSNGNTYSETADALKIDLHEFVAKRAHEMEAMMQSSQEVRGNSLIIQKLPRHMRRRAASHDVRRLPLALRKAASRQAEQSGKPKVSKRPSRRYRRRPRNLLLDYERRKRKHVWLETHIWHAKRFHMTERWGYKIPLYCNERGVRAAYRSSANECLILDLSYYCCIQLTGIESEILNHLHRLTSTSVGSTTFSSRTYINGTREGRCSIYRDGFYPKSAIGEVTFMWRPIGDPLSHRTVKSTETKATLPDASVVEQVSSELLVGRQTSEFLSRDLWIWSHPSCYTLILNEIKNVFSMTAVTAEESDTDDQLRKCKRGPTFSNGFVTLESLKDELCRFKLVGPKSLAVIQAALQPARVEQPSEATSDNGDCLPPCKRVRFSKELLESISESKVPNWWELTCSNEGEVKVVREQMQLWSNMRAVISPSELTPNSIYALTVRDPRLFLPTKKSLDVENCGLDNVTSAKECLATPSSSCCMSAIWDRKIRDEVARTKPSTFQINELRSNYIVPGSVPELGSRESHIPILLVQNPGVRSATGGFSRPGQGCGLDVIVPAGWSTAFWISFIYRRAQPAGLREHGAVAFESGKLLSPDCYPDSPAGEESNVMAYRERYSKYCRMPPAKRSNHFKMGVVAPFHFPWKDLIVEWQVRMNPNECFSSDGFYVVRNRQYLRELSDRVQRTNCIQKDAVQSRKCSSRIIVIRRPSASNWKNAVSCQDGNEKATNNTLNLKCASGSVQNKFCNEPCLVPVVIRMCGRGAPSRYSMICIPENADLHSMSAGSSAGPVEVGHKDNRRKKLIKKAKVKSMTKGTEDETETRQKSAKLKSRKVKYVGTVPVEYASLPLPAVKKVVDTSSRLVIGHVVEGGCSYAIGGEVGLGFVSLHGLLTLLNEQKERKEIRVLIRTNSSYQYRLAQLSINVDFSP